jgi:hypothetical protein
MGEMKRRYQPEMTKHIAIAPPGSFAKNNHWLFSSRSALRECWDLLIRSS